MLSSGLLALCAFFFPFFPEFVKHGVIKVIVGKFTELFVCSGTVFTH